MTVLTKATTNTPSFDELFLEHYDRVYGILFRLVGTRDEAEDLAQEVFLKLHQNPPRSSENMAGWLYRVATNMGYNALRSRKRRWSWQRWLIKDEPAKDPLERVVANETTVAVRVALAKLPPQQGQLLLLRQMGLSYAELADACDINPASVGKQLSRAIAKFRAVYQP
jgi:RNA polymerase sigma-70 factor (ECF subfamily)